MNRLYYGDNLDVLREYIADESVDLIYLDPPFNSRQDYNQFFRSPKGQQSEAQITAFKDTWRWGEQAEHEYKDVLHSPNTDAAEMIRALRRFLGENDMMAYLVMMARRLLELHRVLKPTGTLYLHCDPTASGYLRVVLDSVFGKTNFLNEIIWQRINAKGNVQRKFGAVHDTIFRYAKNAGSETWNQLYRPLDPGYVEKMYRYVEEETGRRYTLSDLTAPMIRASVGQIYEWKGKRPPESRCWVYAKDRMEELERQGRIVYSREGYPRYKRYLDEMPGEKMPDVWTDINPALGREYLGYPTQKPLKLLERVIQASSNEGDLVLDPFCGCGTTVHAAHKLGRQWIGIDIAHNAITLIEKRLGDAWPGITIEVYGRPKDVEGAYDLARRDKYQFQWWACYLIGAQPYQGRKKGADQGIDGLIYFTDVADGKPVDRKIVVSIKGGENVGVSMIRDLIGTVESSGAEIGLFVTLAEPTQPMITEAAKAGFYTAGNGRDYPRIQILTIDDLLTGRKRPEYADLSLGEATFKKAPVEKPSAEQNSLF